MKRRITALMMAAAMCMSLVACGSSNTNTTENNNTAESGSAAAKDTSDLKIGLVTDVGGVNDGSFNQTAWEGMERAAEELGVTVNYLESGTDADYAPNLETFADEEYDLIISIGYMLADATRTAAEQNPDIKFAIVDDATIDLLNVTCLMFRAEQASYLAGYVAGKTTKTNNVGYVAGMANETMNQFGYGYCAGVLDANPDAKIQQFNANSFADAATGKTMANTAITNGADVIFHAAAATGLGVIEACHEAGVYAIGVDSDQSGISPDTVLTSAMKRVDNAVYDTIESLVNGTLESSVHTYDLAEGGVDIAPSQDLIADDVVAEVEEVKEKIINGEIEVPADQESFEEKYGDVYELD
ncbi:MAG: BMP family ABC transporter substrate-binding protein [Clostridiaceae bacterium]|nr:BMP family ABC transporter substrate-binding protein [Clostridiaceae bacterium]